MEILEELRRLGKTIFISSHILSELATLCDHVTILDRGTVKYTGSMRGLISQNEGTTAHYHLTFAAEHPGAIDALTKLPGMLRVTSTAPDRAALHADLRARATRAQCHSANCARGRSEVVAFGEETRHLNQAFMDLTEPGVRAE
jgi:ABC-2 type transport system ATP-binding protein